MSPRRCLRNDGVDFQNATAKTCREVVLVLIARSHMADHVTMKESVVLQQILEDGRRAMRDPNLGFVRHTR